MGMEFLYIAFVLLLIGIIIDYMYKVTSKKPEIWTIILIFAILTATVEQIGIALVGLDVKVIAADWVYGIWIYNVSLESLLFYFILPYTALVIYFSIFDNDTSNPKKR